MKLPFATVNESKLAEASKVLAPYGIEVVPLAVKLWEPDVGTVAEVAQEKLRQVRAQGYERAMVDDAAIFFAAYDQFPGVLSKRVFDRIGYRGIMKLLAGETRAAWFEGTVAVVWDGVEACFTGQTKGEIIACPPNEIVMQPGVPFNPIFVPENTGRVWADLSAEEQLHVSYRSKALKQMAVWLQNQENN